MSFSPDELNALLRIVFGVFCEAAFCELHGGKPWEPAGYIQLLEHLFESCHKRRIRRLILNMPPRSLKSKFASTFYPAWRIAQDPSAKIILANYSSDLGEAFLRDVRKIMHADWYRNAFPNTVLSPDKSSAGHLETTLGGRLYATTPGSTLAGFGADDIILDDIMKPQNATSADARKKLLEWYESEVLNRFDKPQDGVLILVMHRLHVDDISHSLEQKGGYKVFKLPLIAEENGGFCCARTEKILLERNEGEVLSPIHFPLNEVQRVRAETSHATFMARYQQRPIAVGAGLVKTEWFARYKTLPSLEAIFQSWDVATTKGGGSYSVCTTWGYASEKFYLVDVYRRQIEFPDLRKAVRDLDAKFKPNLIAIETQGAGVTVWQDLYTSGMKHLLRCSTTNDKVSRLEECTAFIKDGNVVLPNVAPWLDDYLDEFSQFPEGSADDQVDSTSQLIRYRVEFLHRARIVFKNKITVKSISL